MGFVASSLVGWCLIQAAAAYPHLFFEGEHSCEVGLQPIAPHGGHGAPLRDTTIKMALSMVGDESATEVAAWEPETEYNLTITTPDPMLLLLSTSVGFLGVPDDPSVTCDRRSWMTGADRTKDLRTTHSVLWKSPACCEIELNSVQIVVTGAACEHGHYRQNEMTPEGNCDSCTPGSGLEPEVMRMKGLYNVKYNRCTAGGQGHEGDEGEAGEEGGNGEGSTYAHTHPGVATDTHGGGDAPHTDGEGSDEGDEGDEGATAALADEGNEGDEGSKTEGADDGDEGNEGAASADADEGDEGDEGTEGAHGTTHMHPGGVTHTHDGGDAPHANGEGSDEGDEGDEGATAALADEGDEGDEGAETEGLDDGDEGNEGAALADADEGDEGDEGEQAAAGSLIDGSLSFNSGVSSEEEGPHFSGDGEEGGATTAVAAGDPAASGNADSVPAGGEPAEVEEANSDAKRKKGARTFGAFVLAAVCVAVVVGVVMVVLRRRRMRRYQDFGTLEMRGYDQWSNQAGL